MINKLIDLAKIEQEHGLNKITISYTQVFSRKDVNGNCHYDYKFFTVTKFGEIADITALVFKLTETGRVVERHTKTRYPNLVVETYDDMAETFGFKLIALVDEKMPHSMVELKPMKQVLVNLL
jgi:hypothetical protein